MVLSSSTHHPFHRLGKHIPYEYCVDAYARSVSLSSPNMNGSANDTTPSWLLGATSPPPESSLGCSQIPTREGLMAARPQGLLLPRGLPANLAQRVPNPVRLRRFEPPAVHSWVGASFLLDSNFQCILPL